MTFRGVIWFKLFSYLIFSKCCLIQMTLIQYPNRTNETSLSLKIPCCIMVSTLWYNIYKWIILKPCCPDGSRRALNPPLSRSSCRQPAVEKQPMTMKWSHGNSLTPISAVKDQTTERARRVLIGLFWVPGNSER